MFVGRKDRQIKSRGYRIELDEVENVICSLSEVAEAAVIGVKSSDGTIDVVAVIGEEFGLFGVMLVIGLYLFVVARALYLANQMRDTYARLLAGSFAALFFIYVFINAGMVSGLLPVVGVPLPLISYGGTSMVTLLAGFGILMSLYANRKLAA